LKLTTLCYVEKDDQYLMMHRISKENDVNKDKWIGIGGHFEFGESPEDCLLREAKEETGLTLTKYQFRGIVTFLCDGAEAEYMCLYTADEFEGELTECSEGTLEWVPKSQISKLNLWEGDRIFLQLIADKAPFFSLKLNYEHDVLKEAVLDGEPMELFDILNPDGTPSGRVGERSVIHREGEIHKTVDVWVVRKKKYGGYEVLLQKRAQGKDAFPGYFDTSAAGHVQAGDEYLESAQRELEEELGIKTGFGDLVFIGMHEDRYETEFYGKPFRNHEISAIFVLERDVDVDSLSLQEEEVELVRWMDLDKCLQSMQKRTLKFCIVEERLRMLKTFLAEQEK